MSHIADAPRGIEVGVSLKKRFGKCLAASGKMLNFAKVKFNTNKMPQISDFYGIIIWLNYNDHLPPHFHAWYGEYKAIVNIKDGLVKGEMPGRALRMILEWLDLHREELMENWELAQRGAVLHKIEPLK